MYPQILQKSSVIIILTLKKGEEFMFRKYFLPIAFVIALIFSSLALSPVQAAESYQGDKSEIGIEKRVYYNDFHTFMHIFNYFGQGNYFNAWEKESWYPEAEEGTTDVVEEKDAQEEVEEKPAENNTSPVQDLAEFEVQVVELTNEERTKAGLQPLAIDEELSRVAREKSQDMATSGYFDHTSPNYGSPFDMMRSFGISYRTAGENIAKGQRTPEEVVNAWMNSQGHRENIMNPNFTHIGVGFVETGNHWTQMFIGK